MGRIALVKHDDSALHDPGPWHPEHRGRLPGLFDAVGREWEELSRCVSLHEGVPADIVDLLRVHTPAHLDMLQEASDRAGEVERPVLLTADTPVSASSWVSARASAGCAVTSVDMVISGQVDSAFAVTRPPGHHASAQVATGFCLLNNVAVAACRALTDPSVERVMILDWDVHHGNGTQDIFYADPFVYLISLHLSPHYPGTGATDERGIGEGYGTTRNIPLPGGTSAADYLQHFTDGLDAATEEFQPDLFLISAGFDCLVGDALGGLELEPADLHRMTSLVLERAAAFAAGRTVVVLEGGYVPERIGAGTVAVLRGLAGLPDPTSNEVVAGSRDMDRPSPG